MDDGFTCPHCAVPLDAAAEPAPQEVVCPHCGGFTVIPTVDGAVQPLDDAAPPRAREDELNTVRVRQLSGARRSAYRARSYCVIGALVCVVAVVQLAWTGIRIARAMGFGLQPTGYALGVVVAGWGATYFFRKAMDLDREAKQSSLPTVTEEPDFTPLSDGSQRWKELEEIQ